MDLVQPFSGFPDANWHDCGRRGASPAVPPPRGPLTKTGSTGTPRRHGAVAADTAAIFICPTHPQPFILFIYRIARRTHTHA